MATIVSYYMQRLPNRLKTAAERHVWKWGKICFYCATIAYHVGLNALLVAARHRRPTLEKNKHVVGSAS